MIDETDAREWLRAEFERCRPWIQAALDRDGDFRTHDIEDVWDVIASGQAQLWPLPNSVMVTQIDIYPRLKAIRGWLAGGNLGELKESELRVRKWAEEQGCDFSVIIGREGFARVFDYRRGPRIMIKRLNNG